ncbi:MAG: Asp-tRNA(Asn)/Glu-tRNA(Gln) amidotransferase subunit GatB [Lachnospiraceae bacterium]|nr:Asp-tRNA(Asn)/Glu-tRNA(Gln) amidotransferase subunit GatB [Lachnospiraceae bacterium]
MTAGNIIADDGYETVIGLEVHVELATKTKIFCGCSTKFGAAVNTQVCPVCAGMPGTLPVLNRRVVDYAIAVGLALRCEITRQSGFDRKNYFYPDNPQNYQISQLYAPVCQNGRVEIDTAAGGTKAVGIHEIHMEEDAGKLIHDGAAGITYVDYNRAGVPLLEIVSEPDLRSAEEVIAYLEKLRMYIRYLGVSDCKMQEGSMRADVNLSVRPIGSTAYGTRTEMKNLNSYTAITHAIASERMRQIELLKAGETVVQETRRFDEDRGVSYSMRSKEEAKDYRYFPEPDLPGLAISGEWIARIRSAQPEFRPEKMARYRKEYDIPEYDIAVLTENRALAEIFEETAALCGQPKKAANWLMGETLRLLKEQEMEPEEICFSPAHLAALIGLVERKVINATAAKEVFAVMFAKDVDPVEYVEEKGLQQEQDAGAVRQVCEQVLKDNPQSVADYLGGKDRALGFLVGQAMKASKGKADPGMVNRLLKELLQAK